MTGGIHEAVSQIDGELIEKAIDTDSAQKLREAVRAEKRRAKLKLIRAIAAAAACLCICVCSAILFFSKDNRQTQPLRVTSPITEVSSVEEMRRYLGFPVVSLPEKTVSAYLIYASDGLAQIGEIVYSDGSEYRVSRGSGDISGIFGAAADGSFICENVTVSCYSMSDTRYAIWESNGFAHSYKTASADADFSSTVGRLVKLTEG